MLSESGMRDKKRNEKKEFRVVLFDVIMSNSFCSKMGFLVVF